MPFLVSIGTGSRCLPKPQRIARPDPPRSAVDGIHCKISKI